MLLVQKSYKATLFAKSILLTRAFYCGIWVGEAVKNELGDLPAYLFQLKVFFYT